MAGIDLRIAPSLHLTRRLCRSCGYAGQDLQQADAGPVFCCPSCGADLYARPPKSYAEMELLVVGPSENPRPPSRSRPWPVRVCGAIFSRLLKR